MCIRIPEQDEGDPALPSFEIKLVWQFGWLSPLSSRLMAAVTDPRLSVLITLHLSSLPILSATHPATLEESNSPQSHML